MTYNLFNTFLNFPKTVVHFKSPLAILQLINIPNIPYRNLLSVSGHLARPTPSGCNINLSNKQLNHLPLSVVALPAVVAAVAVVMVVVLARVVANMCRPARS